METKTHKWGHAIILENNEKYCGKILCFNERHQTSWQYHKKKDETLIVKSGSFLFEFEINGKRTVEVILPGEKMRFRPFEKHRIISLKKGEIIEISTHHQDSDTYQLEPGGPL